MTDGRQRFREQLTRNVGYIRRSCELYDQGHQDEAIRIASSEIRDALAQQSSYYSRSWTRCGS